MKKTKTKISFRKPKKKYRGFRKKLCKFKGVSCVGKSRHRTALQNLYPLSRKKEEVLSVFLEIENPKIKKRIFQRSALRRVRICSRLLKLKRYIVTALPGKAKKIYSSFSRAAKKNARKFFRAGKRRFFSSRRARSARRYLTRGKEGISERLQNLKWFRLAEKKKRRLERRILKILSRAKKIGRNGKRKRTKEFWNAGPAYHFRLLLVFAIISSLVLGVLGNTIGQRKPGLSENDIGISEREKDERYVQGLPRIKVEEEELFKSERKDFQAEEDPVFEINLPIAELPVLPEENPAEGLNPDETGISAENPAVSGQETAVVEDTAPAETAGAAGAEETNGAAEVEVDDSGNGPGGNGEISVPDESAAGNQPDQEDAQAGQSAIPGTSPETSPAIPENPADGNAAAGDSQDINQNPNNGIQTDAAPDADFGNDSGGNQTGTEDAPVSSTIPELKKSWRFLKKSESEFAKLPAAFNSKSGYALAEKKRKPAVFVWEKIRNWLGLRTARAAVRRVQKAEVLDSAGEAQKEITTLVDESAGSATITVMKPERAFRPGKYQLKVETLSADGKQILTTTQDFTWGVLAINVNKSIYSPGETAKLQFGVLDEKGYMVCEASLELKIKNEKLKIEEVLSSENGRIKVNREICESKEFTLEPDFEAEYEVGDWGTYEMTLTAETENGTHTIQDSLEVSNAIPFDVERTSVTRIFPKNEYPVVFDIVANQDFKGQIIEEVPESFEIAEENQGNWEGLGEWKEFDEVKAGEKSKTLIWNVDIRKGKKIKLGYAYDAPDESPQFWLLGPLQFVKKNKVIFQEARQWQIAADAVSLKTAGSWARVVADPSSVTIPGSPAAGDRMFLFASWKTYSITCANPSGWTPIGTEYADGAVASGNGTGSIKVMAWYRDWQSGDGNPSLNWSSAPTEAHAVVMLWQKAGGDTWAAPTTVTGAIAAADPFTVNAGSTADVPSGSVVMGLIGLRDDSSTMTRATDAIDDTGALITWNGNYAESPATHFTSTTGQDVSGDLGHRFVTTGASGATLHMDGDILAAESGAAKWVIQGLSAPVVVSGTSGMRTGDTVKVAINGTVYGTTGTIDSGTGNWSISVAGASIASGNSVVVWTDTATAGNQATAIGKWDGSGDMTGMVLNANVLSVGGANSSGVTSAEVDDFTCASSGGSNVMHDFTSSTLNVQGCSKTYTSEGINILASNTLTIGAAETLATFDLTITGTLTSGGASTYNVGRHWTNNGAFTQSSSTVNMNGSTAQTINGSTSTSFNSLNISNSSAAISASTNFTTGGTLTVGAGAILTPGAAVVMNGSGTLTGSGTVQVTRTAATASFGGQYTITNKTLTNLTVEYIGTGQVLTNLTYGNLTISSNAISTGTNDATVGGVFTVGASGVFTPSGGTMTFNNGSSITNSGSCTFQALTIAASATLTVNNSIAVGGTFTVGSSSTLTPNAAAVISGAGTLTGTGTVQVTRTAATPDFSSQYTITNKTLTNLTVDYASASAQTISVVNYSNLSNSGNGNRTLASSGTIGISGTFTKGSGTYTVTGSTVDYNGAGQTVAAINYNNLTLSGSGTKTMQTGTTSIGGNFTLSGTASASTADNLAVTGATTLNGGSLTQGAFTFSTGSLAATSGTLTTAGAAFTVSGTTTVNGGTVHLNNNTGTKLLTGAVAVSSGTLDGASSAIEMRGGLTQSSSGTVSVTGTTSFTTTASQSLSGTIGLGATTIGSGVTLTNNGTTTVSGTLTLTGNWAQANGSTLNYSSTNAFSGAGTFSASTATNTVNYSASGGQTVKDPNGGTAHTYSNLTLSGSGAKTMTGVTTISGNLTLSGTASATLDGSLAVGGQATVNTGTTLGLGSSGYILTLSGSGTGVSRPLYVNGGTLTASGNSTIRYTGTGTTDTESGTIYNLELLPSSGTPIYNLGSAGGQTITLNGNLTAGNGSYNVAAHADTYAPTVNIVGNLSIGASSSFTKGGTLTFSVSGTSTVTDSSSGQDLGAVSATGTNKILSTSSNVKMTSFALQGSDDTLNIADDTLTLTGTATPLNLNGGTFTATNSTVLYIGAGATNITATTYNHLQLAPSSTGQTYTLGTGGGQTISTGGNFSVNDGSGTETVVVTAVANNPILDVNGDFTVNNFGTFTGGSQNIIIGTDGEALGDITLESGSTWNAGSGTLILDGGDDIDLVYFNDKNITKQNMGTVQIGASPATTNLSSDMVADSLTVSTGDRLNTKGYDLDIATFITVNGTLDGTQATSGNGTNINLGTTWTVGGSATFTAQESETYPTIVTFDHTSSGNLSPGGTDENHDFFRIAFAKSSSATITMQAAIDVEDDFAISTSNSTLDAAGYAINVAGSWSNAGTFTHGNNTVTFDSTDTGETIDAGGTGAGKSFYATTFNNSGGGWTVQTSDIKTTSLNITDVSAWALAASRTLEVTGTYTISDAETSATTWNTGSVFYLNGTSQTIGSKTQSAESYDKLQIGTSTDIRMWNSNAVNATTPYTVDSTGSLYSQDHANANGDLYIWGDYHVNTTPNTDDTDHWSYATDFDGAALGGASRQVDVRIDPAGKVTADSAFTLASVGAASANRTTVSRQDSSNGYELVSDGGTINIQYTDFDYLDGPAGLDIRASSAVTELANNTFENLVGTGGTDANITVATSVIGLGNRTFSGNSFSLGAGDKNVARTGADDTETWDFDATNGEADDWNNTASADEANPGMLIWNDSVTNQNPDTPTNLGPAGYIDAAGWMNDNTPTVNFDITDPDPSEQVKYRIQIDDTAGFGSPVLDYQPSSYGAEGTYNYTVGQAGSYAVGSESMTLSDSTAGGGYYWRVKAIDDDLAESAWEEAGTDSTIDFRVDATAPTGGTVNDGAAGDQDWNDGDLNTLQANWSSFNADASGLLKYEYAVRRGSDGWYWNASGSAWQSGESWVNNNTSTSVTVDSVYLNTGENYYFSVKCYDNAGNTENAVVSDGQQILPTLSFAIGGGAVAFADLNDANGRMDTEIKTVTTSTNAANGYTVKAYETQLMTSLAYPSEEIVNFQGEYETPETWDAGEYGFGYTTSDPNVNEGKFVGSKYAAFAPSADAPGDAVADHTDAVNGQTGAVSGEEFSITYKVAVSQSQAASTYRSYVIYVATANY